MFRLLIKLAIAALIINATWRVGSSFWRFYQFEDALQEVAQFGERRTDKQLCGQALEKAANLELPLTAEAITIRRGGNPEFSCASGYEGGVGTGGGQTAKIFINASYVEQLQLLPGYRYPWEFKPAADAWIRP